MQTRCGMSQNIIRAATITTETMIITSILNYAGTTTFNASFTATTDISTTLFLLLVDTVCLHFAAQILTLLLLIDLAQNKKKIQEI